MLHTDIRRLVNALALLLVSVTAVYAALRAG